MFKRPKCPLRQHTNSSENQEKMMVETLTIEKEDKKESLILTGGSFGDALGEFLTGPLRSKIEEGNKG